MSNASQSVSAGPWLFFSPETKGKAMVGDLSLVPVKEYP